MPSSATPTATGDTMRTDRHNPPQRVGERYGRRDGIRMLTDMPLGRLMGLASEARWRRIPEARVTYVIDTNPNYTNICSTGCAFCAFCRPAGAPDSYRLTPTQIAEKVRSAERQGATTVLLQGGHHPSVRLSDWLVYIREIRRTCPGIHIHPFSPAEYVFMARTENVPVETILEAVYAEGIRTIPGGGAEILTPRVRSRVAPRKATVDEWLHACETAHRIGFRTTATMMFGHVETDGDIVDHLLCLRELQDRTGGFTSFIAWSFKPAGSPLGRQVPKAAHPARYVRIVALARLLLDNFPHVQSSWFSESVSAGQLGLLAGADDFGGVLIEENVLKDAGHDRAASVDHVRTIIRRAGFRPVQRDSFYRECEATVG